MVAKIAEWDSDTASPAGGIYTIKEKNDGDEYQEGQYIWSTRQTKNKKYTDDQMFEFNVDKQGCQVKGHSRSQSLSYYDYSVNYCNLWNVYNALGLDWEIPV